MPSPALKVIPDSDPLRPQAKFAIDEPGPAPNAPPDSDPLQPQVKLAISEPFANQRLDSIISNLFPEISRSLAAKLVKSGQALLDGRPAKPSTIAKTGQILAINPPEPVPEALSPAPEVALDVLYLDDDILVINKPAGLTVHPGAGVIGPTLAGALLALDPNLASVGPPTRPGLVHRLDKDTTGVMVAARNQAALEFLSAAFASREVEKSYLAFALDRLPDSGRIDSPIGRHPSSRTKMMAGSPNGKPASTIFQVLRRFPAAKAALIQIKLLTGRTHQARVHLASIGAPVLADPLYGPNKKTLAKEHPSLARLLTRQALHARRLTIPHPKGGRMTFRAPWPADFLAVMAELDRLEGR